MPPSVTRTFDNLYATTQELRLPRVQNVIFERTPLFMLLKEGGALEHITGHTSIQHTLLYGENTTVTSIGKGGTVSLKDPEILTNSEWDWKYVTGHIIRDYTEEQKNSGPGARVNLVNAKFDALSMSYNKALESQLFADGTGNGGLDIDGLGNIVSTSPTTGTVGNINRATYSWWRNLTTDMSAQSSATYFLSNMETMWNDCGKLAGTMRPTPNLLVTTQTVYELYKAEAPEISQIVLDTNIGKYAKLVDLGFGDAAYKGVPLTWSTQCPATNMYFLNTDTLKLTVDGDADFRLGEWIPIADQPTRRVAHSIVTMNLTCGNCAQNAVLTGIGTLA